MQNSTLAYKNIIVPIITHYIPEATIILYGSRARGDFHEGSDIDIVLDARQKISNHIMSSIMEALEDSPLPITFDIVDFHAIPEQMQEKIKKEELVWKE